MEGARTATGMRGEGLGSAEYKNSMVAGTLPQYFVTMSREPRCSIPCSALNILPLYTSSGRLRYEGQIKPLDLFRLLLFEIWHGSRKT